MHFSDDWILLFKNTVRRIPIFNINHCPAKINLGIHELFVFFVDYHIPNLVLDRAETA